MRYERLIPTEVQIFEAERKRTQGKANEAAHAMWLATKQPLLEPFNTISTDEQQRVLMASRIYVVSKISEAKRSWSALTTTRHLARARDAIINVYRDQYVQEELPQIKQDTK